ncbi:hypothetical protein [Alkalihalophilus marmarensis]|uniref:hypothetical protein n=1 Tax=Alkalihalophilus marmarensis TaxID=521377 RepID=UPI002E223F69|nr:hypothetical protein [Alkalihalophilus marmarensis]
MLRQDVLLVIKRRLNISESTEHDASISDYVKQVEFKIKSYCNLTKMPEEIIFLWVSMVIDIMRIDMPNVEFIQDSDEPSNVTIGKFSYSEGNRVSGVSNLTKKTLDDIVLDYRTELNSFSRLRTV